MVLVSKGVEIEMLAFVEPLESVMRLQEYGEGWEVPDEGGMGGWHINRFLH